MGDGNGQGHITNDASRVLGIDPALSTVGWGVVEWDTAHERPRHVAHGTIKTASSEDKLARVFVIARGLRAVIAQHAPSHVACEAYRNYGKVTWGGAQTLYSIGALIGLAVETGLPVTEYDAGACKRGIGVTDGEKSSVQAQVASLLGLSKPVRPTHSADALAAALTHLAHLRKTLFVGSKRGGDALGNGPSLMPAVWVREARRGGARV